MKAKLAVLALAGVTAAHPAWLELLGVNPDHGSGTFETLIVAVCVLSVIGVAVSLARQR